MYGAKRKLPDYPADHKVGMRVPQGGSDCAKCEYVAGQNCTQKDFIKWNGSKLIPAPTDRYCCDFFEYSSPRRRQEEEEAT